MRTFAKVTAALLLGAFAAAANAHVEFAKVRFLELRQAGDRWVPEFELHEWRTVAAFTAWVWMRIPRPPGEIPSSA